MNATTATRAITTTTTRRSLLGGLTLGLAAGLAALTASAAAGGSSSIRHAQGHGSGQGRTDRTRRRQRPEAIPDAPPPPRVHAGYDVLNATLRVYGYDFPPDAAIDVQIRGDWMPLPGAYGVSLDAAARANRHGKFRLVFRHICPSSADVTALQFDAAPVTIHGDFGIYTCFA
jgi:hypothetical protein